MHFSTILLLLFTFLPSTLTSPPLSPRQTSDPSPASLGFDVCAQPCWSSQVASSGCIPNAAGSRAACLCSDRDFLIAFMKCSFHNCTSGPLSSAAYTIVGNCNNAKTPAVMNATELIAAAQDGSSSTSSITVPVSTGSIISNVGTSTISPSSPTTPSSNPSTTTPPTSSGVVSSTSSTPPSSTNTSPAATSTGSTSGGGGGGLDASTIGSILGAIFAGISVILAIIGLFQWRGRDRSRQGLDQFGAARAARRFGSCFCGVGARWKEEPGVNGVVGGGGGVGV